MYKYNEIICFNITKEIHKWKGSSYIMKDQRNHHLKKKKPKIIPIRKKS